MSATCPALLIAAPASGQGKTTVTAALARLHSRAGRRVRVFKCGPDFLDPFWHQLASGAPVHQVDLWMTGEADVRQRLHRAAQEADLILVDPQALLDYDSDAGLTMIHREVFDHPQLVNRSDGVVDKVWIAGKLAWDGATFTPEVGKERFGRLMTARAQTAA